MKTYKYITRVTKLQTSNTELVGAKNTFEATCDEVAIRTAKYIAKNLPEKLNGNKVYGVDLFGTDDFFGYITVKK